ncbi:hypothetical protein HY214_01165 [Candidatus Roizmanbacteria bacterium]|nr:hypothetical protein [Candidatus Roizmanbacteria bacterium]
MLDGPSRNGPATADEIYALYGDFWGLVRIPKDRRLPIELINALRAKVNTKKEWDEKDFTDIFRKLAVMYSFAIETASPHQTVDAEVMMECVEDGLNVNRIMYGPWEGEYEVARPVDPKAQEDYKNMGEFLSEKYQGKESDKPLHLALLTEYGMGSYYLNTIFKKHNIRGEARIPYIMAYTAGIVANNHKTRKHSSYSSAEMAAVWITESLMEPNRPQAGLGSHIRRTGQLDFESWFDREGTYVYFNRTNDKDKLDAYNRTKDIAVGAFHAMGQFGLRPEDSGYRIYGDNYFPPVTLRSSTATVTLPRGK